MADPILIRNHALLAKIEATHGVDSVPTGVANAIKISNLTWSPMEVEMADRATSQPYLGNSDQVVVARWNKAEFDVEIAGAGDAGDLPQYDPLLQGCGFAATVDADVSVTYKPISENFKTLTLYMNIGGVLYKSLFVAGSVAFNLNARAIPTMRFSMTGLYQAIADQALPATTYRDTKPVAVNKQNTPQLSLHGYAGVVQQLSLDMKNDVQYRNMVNHESVRITDRKPDGSIRMESTKVGEKNWWPSIEQGVVGPLSLRHGTAPGNIVEINAPGVQLMQPAFDADNGIQMLRANLICKPVVGNDDVQIIVR